jgi:Mrp family chromosome partitioning ATPase
LAISLARWAAAENRQVLLVDADLSQPELSKLVGLGPRLSWLEALHQNSPAAECVIRAAQSGVCVMPLGPVSTRTALPRFTFDQLGQFLESIDRYFDLILFDVGPASQLMIQVSDPQRLCDAVLLVRDVGRTAANDFNRIQAGLLSFGIERLAIAENFVPVAKDGDSQPNPFTVPSGLDLT